MGGGCGCRGRGAGAAGRGGGPGRTLEALKGPDLKVLQRHLLLRALCVHGQARLLQEVAAVSAARAGGAAALHLLVLLVLLSQTVGPPSLEGGVFC